MIKVDKSCLQEYGALLGFGVVGAFLLKASYSSFNRVIANKESLSQRVFSFIKGSTFTALSLFCFAVIYFELEKKLSIPSKPFDFDSNQVEKIKKDKIQLLQNLQEDQITIDESKFWTHQLVCDNFYLGQAALTIAQRCSKSQNQQLKQSCKQAGEALEYILQRNSARIDHINQFILKMKNATHQLLGDCQGLFSSMQTSLHNTTLIKGVSIDWDQACMGSLGFFKSLCYPYREVAQECAALKAIESHLPSLYTPEDQAKECMNLHKINWIGLKPHFASVSELCEFDLFKDLDICKQGQVANK